MVQLQLYIEGQEVELYKDESISLTQSIQDIKDISKIFTDFTKTFNVPASKINNKIFKHFHNTHIRSYNPKTKTFESFDARKKKDAELTLNYKPFKQGKIKFEGVQLKNNEPHTYKITFFGNTINLKDILKEDKLSNLSQLNLFDFKYNTNNIITYLSDGLDVNFFDGLIDDAIIFPLITHSGRLIFDNTKTNDTDNKIYNINPNAGATNSYGVPLRELKPAIRLYAIIKAIENQVGYDIKFSTDFFNNTNFEFYNLYMWLHNKEGALFQDQDAQYQITGFTNVVQADGTAGSIQGVTNKTFVNDYNENNLDRFLRVNVRPSGTAAYSLVIKKDGEEFKRFDNLTGVTTNGITDFKKEDIEIPNGTYTFFIETLVSSDYDVDISIEQVREGLFKNKQIITIKDATASFATDEEITITSVIPEMKVIDFVTGLFKMFNLTAYQDTSGTIVVQTLDNFYSSSTQVWDITKDLDKTETVVDSILPFKDVIFKYKGTESFLANNHKELSNIDWGSLEYKTSQKYDGKTYEVELPFEHFKYEHLYITDNDVIQTTTTTDGNQEKSNSLVQYGYSVDKQQEPYKGEPLLFYASPSFQSIRVINLDGSAQPTAVANPYMPLNTISTLNVFGLLEYQNLNFNAEFEEYTRTVNQKTLFKTYYENYVKDMFDKRKRITTVKAYLPLEVLVKLNLADKIIVFDDIYRINKITTNFETNLSNIELTNIFEEVSFKTIKYVAQNCLTIDSTLTQSDDNILTVDAGCEREFTIPDVTTVVPNEIPNNNPTPVYDQTPLVVTAPTIEEYQVTVPTATSVFFNYKITGFGKLGDTQQIDEYGFLYSTTQSNLTGSDDVDVLKETSGVFAVPYLTSSFFTVPKVVNYEKSGLTHPQTYYWRFYARTNTDTSHSFADSISDVKTASTVATVVNQYNNATGELLSGLVGSDLTGTCSLCHGTLQFGYLTYSNQIDPPDLDGVTDAFRLRNVMNYWSIAAIKEIVKWFASVPDPAKATWYPITHTWKYLNNQGNDGLFNMGDVSDAYVKWDVTPHGRTVIYIKGGTVTGSSFGGGTGNILNNTGDLESTS